MNLNEYQATWEQIRARFPEANLLQSPEWGRANQLIGHKVLIDHAGLETWALMIVKNAKRGRYLEIPGGPLLNWSDQALARSTLAKIKAIARREKCVFVRLRPQLHVNHLERLEGLGLQKAPMHLHAEHTIILDLTKDEAALLDEMRRQTRYEVRRADKFHIAVEQDNSEKMFREFHSVQAKTAERQHFVPPDLKTLLAEREAFGDNALIYVAKSGQQDLDPALRKKKKEELSIRERALVVEPGQPIAYGLILISGPEAEYFEAASTDLNQQLPGAYALQWRVIRDLKARGIERYNLWGIAPPGVENHRYSGVTTFKSGFGGKMVEYVPAQDLIVRPCRYRFNWLVETLRKKKRHL